MKKAYLLFVSVFLVTFLSSIIFSIYYFQIGDKFAIVSNPSFNESTSKAQYHFAVIVHNTVDPFWLSFKEGITTAAEELNVEVEFNGPRFTNIDEELQYLDIAIASKVDGILTHVGDEERFRPLINKATEKNIPCITIKDDSADSKRIAFIGTNNYKSGQEAGRLLVEATGGKAGVAVILNTFNNDYKKNLSQNLYLTGFKEAVKSFSTVNITTIRYTGNGIFNAEEVTREVLNEFPEVNAILCTSSKDTTGAAQVLVDINKVGSVIIIGCDNTPEILRYIDKGIIYGTVASNPYMMGYEGIKTMVEAKRKKRTSSYIDTGVEVINSKNLHEFVKNDESNEE
ncbi:MAG: substrate-binding domain-containing protein [Clostridia bacterium]|nr:substrate-binding domain-containing protein [Clostridia bacterium]